MAHKIIEGLREAVRHAAGEDTGARETIVLTSAEMERFRHCLENPRHPTAKEIAAAVAYREAMERKPDPK